VLTSSNILFTYEMNSDTCLVSVLNTVTIIDVEFSILFEILLPRP
jgi:hypothetical protein